MGNLRLNIMRGSIVAEPAQDTGTLVATKQIDSGGTVLRIVSYFYHILRFFAVIKLTTKLSKKQINIIDSLGYANPVFLFRLTPE
ncbi:hypothetical protein GCM10007895_07490 [Paraferrimonas sedimenticola]|uniref:Uncharacterized protein n=1 Tax=Paraferrimonas sedimenticola TaxID=375674 RepID=A0AA37W0I8_9GAMM|nr:hypothetical protein GCM10007895_07490 [Paraferrimonas sedimenticola]